MTRSRALAAACVAALVAPGCGDGGGGDDPAPTASAPPTASSPPTAGAPSTVAPAPPAAGARTVGQWRDGVNAVCRRNAGKAAAVVAAVRAEGLKGREATVAVLERSSEGQAALLDELLAVEAPPSLEAGFARFGADLRKALPLFDRLTDAVREGREEPGLSRQLAAVAARTRPFAVENGITDCVPAQAAP